MDEEWVTIEEAPDYELNEQGVIRRIRNQLVIKQRTDYGPPKVRLMVDGEPRRFYVDGLVERYFGNDFEIWIPIQEARMYEISRTRQVRNRRTGHIVKQFPNNRTGRPQVTLMDAGVRITRQVHLLMEDAFGRQN